MNLLPSRNVLSGPLKPCSLPSLTDFFRKRHCDTCAEDHDGQSVCVEVSQVFLDAGNDQHLARVCP